MGSDVRLCACAVAFVTGHARVVYIARVWRTSPSGRSIVATFAALGGLVSPEFARGEGGFRKGPWLMEPHDDSITVMAQRDTPGPVTARAWRVQRPGRGADTAGEPQIESSDGASVTMHEFSLRGLRAGERYRYEVSGPGLTPTGGTFSTPPLAGAPFRFVIYGDTRSGDVAHAAIVGALRNEGAEFLLHTGDLLADGRQENQWQGFFDIERELLRNAPLVPVIGNHEISTPGSNGVEHFRNYMHCDPSSVRPELDYSFAYGSVRLVVANAFDNWQLPERRAWLDAQLARARREVPDGFVIVAMHWGLCSCGPHGENRSMRAVGLDDVMRRHHVDLVVSGHDHAYERGDDHGLRYLVSGGGGAPLYGQSHSRAYTLTFAREHHYVRADVERSRIVFTALRLDGSVIERCGLTGHGWDCPALAASSRGQRTSAALCGCSTPGRLASSHGVALVVFCAVVAAIARRRRFSH